MVATGPHAVIALLRKVHAKLDAVNADRLASGGCYWCGLVGYDADGLLHKDDCIVVEIRKVLDGDRH